METIQAIQVSSAWTTSDNLSSELKIKLNTSYFTAILDNIDKYDLILNYLSGIIWNYYKNYYLVTSTKERCIELLANELSGKLNYYYALINEYKKAFSSDYSKIRGTTTTNTRENKLTRDGLNKQATTPETIEAGADYIDDYSTSEQKYNSNATETGSNNFTSSIIGSNKDLWENINAIPKTIYESVIGLVSKYFFYVYDNELEPSVELTLEQAIKDLDTKIIELGDTLAVNVETIDNNIERLTSVTPTDIGVKEGKLGLLHDTKWLTNQGAITIGSNLNYIAETNTLNANVSQAEVSSKQDRLVSGTNIKTINGNSLLGSGDLTIEGGGSDVAIITLTDAQVQSLSNFSITFTQEQATLLENASSFKFIYNGVEIAHGQCGKIKQNDTTWYGLSMILGSLIFSGANSSGGSLSDYKEEIFLYSAFPLNVLSSVSLESNNVINFNSYYDGNIFIDSTKPKSVYFDTINGKPILHTGSTINEYTIPDTKTISLFGNHSILVSKDSTDTNIDLYNHAIIFNFDYGDNDDMYNVYLNVVSSRNLVVDSLTDLKTLLGNTFTRSCSASSDNLNDHVVAVRETGFIISDLTSISFASAKNLKITDTVTTI